MEAAVQQTVFGSTGKFCVIAFTQPKHTHHQSRLSSTCMRAEYEDWHSDLKWMQQTFVWPADLQTQCGAETNLSKFCILLQPHHITSYCQSMVQSNQGLSQLDTARQQRLLTAVSRISMHQRMHIVFMGYRARFAEFGVCTRGESGMLNQDSESTLFDGICCRCQSQPIHLTLCMYYGMQSDATAACCCCMLAGDIAFLEMSDVDSLNLPKLAQDTVTSYVQQRLCRPPLLLNLTSMVAYMQMPTKVNCQMLSFVQRCCGIFAKLPTLCSNTHPAVVCLQTLLNKFHLNSCLPLFAEEQLNTIQVHPTLC